MPTLTSNFWVVGAPLIPNLSNRKGLNSPIFELNFPSPIVSSQKLTQLHVQPVSPLMRASLSNRFRLKSICSITPVLTLFALTGMSKCQNLAEIYRQEVFECKNQILQTCRASAAVAFEESSEEFGSRAKPRVAVIGGGLAGLAASVEILRHGGFVVIIEKCDRLGGNSAKASSGINAANSAQQHNHGVDDNLLEFQEDTLRSGKGLSNPILVKQLVDKSAAAVDFLQEFGVDLSNIARLGGHSHPRTHRAGFDGKAMNVGYRIMSSLTKFIEGQKKDKVLVVKNSRALELLFDDEHKINGVRCEVTTKSDDGQETTETSDIAASAVILATGGFCADRHGLLSQFVPDLKDLATTNGPFASGDGIRLGINAGADLVDMEEVQLHPTAFVNPNDPTNPTKFLAPEALRGCGGILLNHKGERFVNELDTRDAVVKGIRECCKPLPSKHGEGNMATMPLVAYLVLNTAGISAFDRTTTDFYISKGLIQKFENARTMSESLSLPFEAVHRTLVEYGHPSDEEASPTIGHERQEGMHLPSESTPPLDDPFGKPVFPNLFSPNEELYVSLVTPALHYCMGGLRFDADGRIISRNGTAIPGLYGAGEVTGGVHGKNRLAGNSLLECVVYGRVAGISSMRYTTQSLPE